MPKRYSTRFNGKLETRYTSKAYNAYAAAYAATWLGAIMANGMYMAMNRRGFTRRVLDAIEGRTPEPVRVPQQIEIPERIEYSRHIANYPIPPEWKTSLFDFKDMRRLREAKAQVTA
jgi:hypothetical protein